MVAGPSPQPSPRRGEGGAHAGRAPRGLRRVGNGWQPAGGLPLGGSSRHHTVVVRLTISILWRMTGEKWKRATPVSRLKADGIGGACGLHGNWMTDSRGVGSSFGTSSMTRGRTGMYSLPVKHRGCRDRGPPLTINHQASESDRGKRVSPRLPPFPLEGHGPGQTVTLPSLCGPGSGFRSRPTQGRNPSGPAPVGHELRTPDAAAPPPVFSRLPGRPGRTVLRGTALPRRPRGQCAPPCSG